MTYTRGKNIEIIEFQFRMETAMEDKMWVENKANFFHRKTSTYCQTATHPSTQPNEHMME